ncbi:TonB-dependent receptor [Temperatibacter marinus]|uniref:TonB-dependent receptor n=1 Tax=Temperatibacter marinus TaxID=1456591 RepID=A0AA52H9Y8_9PROT|nr:TonB-dependent receptor [Temperatibacter marinus]WND03414.1 TonB-dependent receptor [Temperatibacter marinus]
MPENNKMIKLPRQRATALLTTTAMGLTLTLAAPQVAAQDNDEASLEEITVTATRRAASIQSIPYNISAMSGNALENFGARDLTEISRMVPGIQFIDTGARQNGKLIMRGLSDGPLQAAENQGSGTTVSRYMNETPLTADIKLFDIDRIEVLRGPQGTLYGRGAMGGTLRYITKKPVMNDVSGEMDAEFYLTKDSGSVSQEFTGVANVSYSDNFAVRAAVNYLHDSGFVDYNYVHLVPGVSDAPKPVEDNNGEETLNVKIAALMKLSEETEISASYYMQDQFAEGRQAVNPDFTGEKYVSSLRYTEPRWNKDEIFNLEISHEGEDLSVLSSTSYSKYTGDGRRDQTDLLLFLWPGYGDFAQFSSFTKEEAESETFVHETRVLSNNEGALNWIAGLYYEHDSGQNRSREYVPGYLQWAGFTTGNGALEYDSYGDDSFEEKAVFGEITYDFSDQLHVTVGARYFEQSVNIKESCTWLVLLDSAPDCVDPNEGGINDTVFKLNVSYDVSDDVLFYGTVAEGFRRGGINNIKDPLDSERTYGPDRVTNYEFGWHAKLLDNKWVFNGAVFYVDWTDIQIDAKSVNTAENITINAGKASSKGMELEGKYALSQAWTVGASYTYTDAQIEETIMDAGVIEGNKLPGVPEHQWSAYFDFSTDYDGGTIFANGSLFYRGKAKALVNKIAMFNNTDQFTMDDYVLANVAAGYNKDNWNVRVYVNNLFNKFAITGGRGARRYGDQGQFFYVVSPRTAGVSFGYDF